MPLFSIFSKKKKEEKTPAKGAKDAEAKMEEKRRKEEKKILEAQSANYKPPNLFDGMQLNSVPNPKPPPPNPGVENLKNQKSDPTSFGFLVPNNVPEEPVQEEKPIKSEDIFQGLNTIVPDLKVSPFSLKDVKDKEESMDSAQNIDTQIEIPKPTPVTNPSPFDLMDLFSDQPFKPSPQPTIQHEPPKTLEPKPQSVLSKASEDLEDMKQERGDRSPPRIVKESSTGQQKAQRNSMQGLRRKGDGVTYKWSMDLIKQKQQQEEMERRQQEANQEKMQQISIEPKQQQRKQEIEKYASRERRQSKDVKQDKVNPPPFTPPVTAHPATYPRSKNPDPSPNIVQAPTPVVAPVAAGHSSFASILEPKFDFAKVNNLEELKKGLKSFKEQLIKVTLQQHQITQRLEEWKRKIENKEETLKLAIEKENQLVAQELFEEGEKVKEMVDALKNELETMNQALKSLEKDYNQKEFQKTEIVLKIIKNMEKSRDHFESKLDYSRGRLLNWETNEKKKLTLKQQQGENKVQELESLEKKVNETKESLDNEQKQLQHKIFENTKDIVKRKEEVQEELDSVDGEIEKLKKQMQQLQGIRDGLEDNLKECEQQIQQQEGKFGEDLAVINSLKKSIDKDEERINGLYEEIGAIQEEVEQLQEKIENYKQESEANIAIWSANLEGVTGQIEKYEAENTIRLKVIHSISSVSEKLKLLESEEKECSEALERAKSQVSDLEIEMEQLKKEMESIGHKLQTAEMNKKKMAAARQFNKAAIHVKEIKQFKEQTGMTEQQLQENNAKLSEKNQMIDELSLKLPSLTHDIEELNLELKKSKKVFLEIRLTELEEMKEILSNESQTPDFKKLSVIREEKQSTEQELMRIKAVLQLSEEKEEEKEETQEQVIIDPPEQVVAPKESEVDIQEDYLNSGKKQKEADQVDVEERIKDLKRKIDEHEDRINKASEEDDFEEAAKLEDEKIDMVEELEKLGEMVEGKEGKETDDGKEEVNLDIQTQEEEEEEQGNEESEKEGLMEEKEEGQNALKEVKDEGGEGQEEVKLNDREVDNQKGDNEDAKREEKDEEEIEVQNDEKQSHEDEPQAEEEQEEEDQLQVKLEETKEEHRNDPEIEKSEEEEEGNEEVEKAAEERIKEKEELKSEEADQKEDSEKKQEADMRDVKEDKTEEKTGGFSLGGGAGLFSGMSFK